MNIAYSAEEKQTILKEKQVAMMERQRWIRENKGKSVNKRTRPPRRLPVSHEDPEKVERLMQIAESLTIKDTIGPHNTELFGSTLGERVFRNW